MIQALNANHFLFRIIFKWYSFIGRMSGKIQWIIILGLFFGNRILSSMAEQFPAMAFLIRPIIFLYLIFAITSWIANPLFNTILRFSRYGKYLLDDQQIMGSNAIAAMSLFGLLLGCGLALFNPQQGLHHFLIGMGYGLLMLMPISATFSCESGYPFITMAVVTSILGSLGLGAIGLMLLIGGLPLVPTLAFIYGNIGAQFLGNYLASVEVKR